MASKYTSSFKYKIVDDTPIRTNYILSGKQLSETAKQTTILVVKYYLEHDDMIQNKNETQQQIVNDVKALAAKNPNFTYNDLVVMFGAESSFECLMSYLLTGFMTGNTNDPMKVLMYTYGRAIPLENDTEWMDNFRINNIGFPLNMLVWGKHDSETTYSIHQMEPLPINDSVELNDYKKMYEMLVTPFRGILLHNMMNIDYNNYKQMCDECYKRFPCCFCGAHGCDVFDIPSMSINIAEIRQALNRYPSWHIQYVLNTATYASRSGIHWVALEFTDKFAKLICSQASNFGCFRDGGKIANELPKYGFNMIYNQSSVQTDGYNCGIFAPISLYMLLIYDGDIVRAVKEGIGKDGVNIHGTKTDPNVNIDVVRKKVIGSST